MTRVSRVFSIMICAVVLTLFAGPSAPRAQSVAPPIEGFLRTGDGFACRERAAPGMSPEAWVATLPCMRFGPLALSMTAAEADAVIGRPFRAIDRGAGMTARAYFLGQAGQRPYIIVFIRGEEIVALQMTGELGDGRFVFSGIAPGMSQAQLLERFGAPFSREPVPSVGAELWEYGPWPFSFEVRDNLVFSVRISRGNGN